MTVPVRHRAPSGHRAPPGGPDPSRLRLILGAALAGAAVVVPLVLFGGNGSPQRSAPPMAAPSATSSAPATTSAAVDPLAAGRALAAQPATSPGVLDTMIGDFGSHVDNSGGPGLINGGAHPQVVDGGKAMQFAIPGGGERSEVLPLLPEYHEGDDLWVHDVSTLHDLPTGTTTWQLVLQWHQRANTGSPPIALEAGVGRLRLANVGTNEQDVGPLGPNDTIDVVVHVHFSQNPAVGTVDIWRDGVHKINNYHPPKGTLLDKGDYLKLGLYRDPSITQSSSMTTTRLVVGPTAAAINASGITPR